MNSIQSLVIKLALIYSPSPQQPCKGLGTLPLSYLWSTHHGKFLFFLFRFTFLFVILSSFSFFSFFVLRIYFLFFLFPFSLYFFLFLFPFLLYFSFLTCQILFIYSTNDIYDTCVLQRCHNLRDIGQPCGFYNTCYAIIYKSILNAYTAYIDVCICDELGYILNLIITLCRQLGLYIITAQ